MNSGWLTAMVVLGAGIVCAQDADVERLRRAAQEASYEITQLKAEPDHVFVEYVIRPTSESFIRCQLALPVSSEKWNGRLWGFGNGGAAGGVRVNVDVAKRGSAAVHTDMGSSKGVHGKPEVMRDFGWRATHLMTESAKVLVRACLGSAPSKSYFIGGSTGGGQGFHEALRFPEDYDGVIAYVPANTRIPLHVYFAWNLRLMNDAEGRPVFSKAELKAVEDAAIEYFADKDEPWARGRFLSDSRYTPEREKGILAVAKKRCPSLDTPDKLERLHKMFYGPVIEGRHVHSGVPFSAAMEPAAGNQWMLQWYLGPGRALHTVTDAELAAWLREWGPDCDACGEGFAAFAKRGGKMIVIGGLEDSIVPYPSMIEWYERAAKETGGAEALENACRLYLLPGRAHGKGRGCGGIIGDCDLIVDWVEKGVRPNEVKSDLKPGETLTVKPYPCYFSALSAAKAD